MTPNCRMGKSRRDTEPVSTFPRPGQENTVSTMSEPLMSPATSRPSTVMSGSTAFLMTCSPITRDSGIPLARAVRT